MHPRIQNLLYRAAGAVGEPICPLCRAPLDAKEGFLCSGCLEKLASEAAEPCGICGAPPSLCTCPDSSLSPLPVSLGGRNRLMCTWYDHAGTDRLTETMLLTCKRQYSPAISAYIARRMADVLSPVLPENAGKHWILTYAPRSLQGFTDHGFDQCEEIVRQMGKILHIPVRKLLIRIGGAEQKTMTSARHRAENIAGAFAAVRVPQNCRVLLFDDIITTGSTMREAGQVLAEAGAAAIFPLAFAKTMHKPRP